MVQGGILIFIAQFATHYHFIHDTWYGVSGCVLHECFALFGNGVQDEAGYKVKFTN